VLVVFLKYSLSIIFLVRGNLKTLLCEPDGTGAISMEKFMR
jgi:hypothetical protein